MRPIARSLTTALAAVALIAPVAGPASAAPAPNPPVEWVVASSDTLAVTIDRAVQTQDPKAVAASLRALSARATANQKVDFPGLDEVSTSTVAQVTDAAATALETGKAQPKAVKDFKVNRDEGHVVPSIESLRGGAPGGGFGGAGSAVPFGYISSQGYSYVQDNWVRRGLTTTTGTVNWTDKLTATWVTTPSWSSSRHTITMRYFPSTGFFSSPSFDVDAYNGGTNAFIGSVSSTSVTLSGSSTKYTTYNSMSGKSLYHVANLYAKTRLGTTAIDGQTTARAGCYTTSTAACKY